MSKAGKIEALCMNLVEFLSLYPLRAPRIMWLLGAGASVLAGLPTATTLIWEFKRALYCYKHNVSPTRFPNLEDPAFQSLVQSYFDSAKGYPPVWSDEEYSFYFEKYLPDEGDRRRFLDKQLGGIKPSYGHYCLAGLLALKQAYLVWTTNFDTLIERAAAQDVITSYIPDGLTVLSLESPEKAHDVFRDDRWPALVKLHGDFKHRKLMNTAQELQMQNDVLGNYRHKPRERRDYLVEFPSFSAAFGVGIDAPQSSDDPCIITLQRDHISKALNSDTPAEKMAELVHSAIRGLHRMRTHFDVAIVYLPDFLSAAFRSPSDDNLSDFDLHDSVKALSSSLQVPLQVLNDEALNYQCRCSVMWRLSIALYAKAGGIPWKLDNFEDRHAYVGLSYCIRKLPEPRFVTCCSQLFDSQGAHLRFLLYESHEGQYEGDNPYLPRQDMYRVMTRTLSLYQLQKGGPPSRLVVHKTTPFTKEEIEGCVDALGTVDNLELLTLTQNRPWQGIRIDKPRDATSMKGLPAQFPLDRRATLPLGLFSFLLWIQGNCKRISDRAYFKEGKGIPHPIRVTRFVGAGGFHEGAREIIGLTKMNWNNDSLYDHIPVTIRYASILARIVKRMGSLSSTPYDFRYCM